MSDRHSNDDHGGPWREPEREAFEPVLDAFEAVLEAIEDGFDVEGVRPEFKALLADLHEQAGLCIGIQPVRLPRDADEDERRRELRQAFVPSPPRELTADDARMALAEGEGGIYELDGLIDHNRYDDSASRPWWALCDHGALTVAAAEKLARAGQLTTIRGVGPKAAARIEAALRQHATEPVRREGGES
jgi:hypothetical protein